MRIGVNVRLFTNHNPEGIGRYMYETLKVMTQEHSRHEFIFFFDRQYSNDFLFAENIIPVIIKPKAIHAILWYFWFEWRLPYYLKKYKVDVFLSPDGFASTRTSVPTCIVVHDLAFVHYPHFFKKATAVYYQKFVPQFLRKARTIAAVSNYTKEDIKTFVPDKEGQITVTGCAASDGFKPITQDKIQFVRDKIAGGAPYFFFVGALHPRKNIVNLLKAFEILCRENVREAKLVIAGRMAWRSNEIKKAIEEFPFKKQLIYHGPVSSDELPDLMAAAYAVVYPSVFEGFGIPILESMLCDVPVITSNTSSMPEAGGDAALYADPQKPEEIALQMKRMLFEPGLRTGLIEKGRVQRKKFSWQSTSERLWNCIEQAIKKEQ